MKNFFIVLLLVATAAVGAFALHQRNELSQLQSKLAAAEDRWKAAEEKLAARIEADQKIALTESKAKALQETLTAASAQAAEQSEQVSQLEQSLAAAKTNTGGLAALFKDPDMKQMIKAQQKTALGPMIDKMYGDVYKQLNLTPEQSAQLKDLLQKKMMTASELGISMLDGSLDASQRADLTKQLKTETDAADAQIKELLGENGYKDFKQYEGTLGDRLAVGQFRDQVAGTSAALSPALETQLIDALQQERASFKWTTDPARYNSANPGDPDLAELLTEDRLNKLAEEQTRFNQQFLTRARTILSPEQFAEYEKFQENQTRMQISAMKLAAKMFGTKNP